MSPVDEGLVQYMADYPDIEMAPRDWYHNVSKEQRVSYGHVKKRLGLLEDAGLVDRYVDENNVGRYSISDLGLRYVEGEVSKERMEELDPRPDPEDEEEDDEDGADETAES